MSVTASLQAAPAKRQASVASTTKGLLQRKCACGSSKSPLGEMCDECQSGNLQRKLAIGASNDPLEREADRIADQVLAAPAHFAVGGAPPHIQRYSGQSNGLDAAPASVDQALASAGRPLEPALRQDMEQRFDYDFSRVRVHSGAAAEQSARDVNAHAYTMGHNIVFGAGRFAPGMHEGRRLIAHELTHVVQQSGEDGVRAGQRNGKRGLSPITQRAHRQTTVQRFGLVLDFEKLAKEIEDAVSGPGTDEEKIFRALTRLQRDPDSVRELEATYRRLFSETLMQALQGDLDREEMDYAKGLMGKAVTAGSKQRIEATAPTTPAQWDALARRIKAAVEYGFFGGTDEEAIFAVLLPLSGDANKIAAIKEAYARVTRGPADALVKAIKSEMSGSELRYALELLAVKDPHAGTRTELTRDQVLAVRNELQPGTAVAPPPPPPPGAPPPPLPAPAPWDGRPGAPGEAANRAALKAQLTTDLTNHLTRVMPGITAEAANPKLPVANLEGAANAAVEVTDDEYKSWYGVAATTPGQAALRSGFLFSQAAGNLLDATDPAARAAVGIPLSGSSVANWMVRHDDPPVPPGAVEHMAAHNFNPDRTPDPHGERAWLRTQVINPFIAPPARNADLLLYDQFGFALQPEPGKIVLPTTVAGSSLAGGGAPNIADRSKLWSTWHIAVHEYLHNLAHPAFDESLSANNEGFTEYFTKNVIKKVAPVAHQNRGLVSKVEGGIFAPPTTPALVRPYTTPRTYAADLAHVENVAKTVPGGDNAIRAAYFQGHTEMLGIDAATQDFATAPPAAVDPTLVKVPAGITTLDDLATRSGVPKSEILKANAGLTAAGPLPPKLKLLGAREHKVVATFEPAGVIGPSETVDKIAAQNGVSVEALKRANPGTLWGALAAGQLVLIPRH